MVPPFRQLRALTTDTTVRVYQAYSPAIARPAVAARTFVEPFRRGRMTWIKPSFLWMMYRSGYATKTDQECILAVDISHEGLIEALSLSCSSHHDPAVYPDSSAWQRALKVSPVRIQWDPERSLRLGPLDWRAIQIGLEREAVDLYLDRWITGITDVTPLARSIHAAVERGDEATARSLLPEETPYTLPEPLRRRIGAS
jgi:hypothetical protein